MLQVGPVYVNLQADNMVRSVNLQMMFRVEDQDKSIQYYTEALGMKVIRQKDNEKVCSSSIVFPA